MAPSSVDWYARLTAALDGDDPEQARRRMRPLLEELREDEARAAERRQMLSAASSEGILVHVDHLVIDVNQRLCEMLGYERHELLGPDTLRKCVAPEDVPDVLARVAARYEGAYVVTGVRKDGSRFRAELWSKQGHVGARPVRLAVIRDVTARERTSELLRESERRFRDMVHAAFDFTVFTRDGVIVDVDGDPRAVLGLAPAGLLGRTVLDVTAPSAQPVVRQRMEDGFVGAYEAVALNASGEPVPVLCTVALTTLNGQPVRAASLRNLRPVRRLEAERRALEQRLERAQRLDSLGVLAGGIAHDFNNLLAGVLGNAELLRDMVPEGGPRQIAGDIVTAAQRAATLTRQMLAYAGRREPGLREPVDVASLVGELRVLLSATLSKKARVDVKIEEGSAVLGNRATLAQVMMNVLTNASDALGDGAGAIEVRARRVTGVDARWDAAVGATVGPGSWVLIEVRDTGIGMDDATRGRVFEPFFSTKERGHGLGMAASLGIVTSHGGAVLIESAPGKGSCVSVLLPAAPGAPQEESAGRGARVARPPGRVLIIDDEPLVRSQLRRSLELRGYSVVEAVDGRAGLDAVSRQKPDLVILDMTMPDLDGAEVLRRLRDSGAQRPGGRLFGLPRHLDRAPAAAGRVPGVPAQALWRQRSGRGNRPGAVGAGAARRVRRAVRPARAGRAAPPPAGRACSARRRRTP